MNRLHLFGIALLAAGGSLGAAGPPLRLWLETSTQEQRLTVIPHLEAPAGTTLRYEMVASKNGPSGNTSTNQSGEVRVGQTGTSALSTLTLGLGAQDRCSISVKLYDGKQVVAERTFSVPD